MNSWCYSPKTNQLMLQIMAQLNLRKSHQKEFYKKAICHLMLKWLGICHKSFPWSEPQLTKKVDLEQNHPKTKTFSIFIILTWCHTSDFRCIFSVIISNSIRGWFSFAMEKQWNNLCTFLHSILERFQCRTGLRIVLLCIIDSSKRLEISILFPLARLMKFGRWCFLHLEMAELFKHQIISSV